VGLEDLAIVLESIEDAYPGLSADRRFVLWFVRAFGSGSMEEAAGALPGPSNEKGVDAVFIDRTYGRVMLVQGKYQTRPSPSPEKWSDIVALVDAARTLVGGQPAFDHFVQNIDPRVKELLRIARKLLATGEYDLDVCYATSGSISSDHRRRAALKVAAIRVGMDKRARFVPYTRSQILGLVEREMDGATPPVPPVILPLDSRSTMEHVESVGTKKHGLTMWAFSVNGAEFVRRVKPYKLRIFNSNVRGFLGIGEEGINKEIFTTIEKSPHHFVFVNNGITMLCTEAKPDRERGVDVLEIHEPQIVNGQQTTRVLESAGKAARNVSVLVRVIEVPTEPALISDGDLTSRIVKATNRQNRISSADLKSNERRQIWLETELEAFGYRYIRKRESRAETSSGPRARKQLRKEKLAHAVAACISDTLGLQGNEPRFDKHYEAIFSSKDPRFYLLCFLLFDRVSGLDKKSGERVWGRFVVVRFLWKRLETDLRRYRGVVIPLMQKKGRNAAIDAALAKVIKCVSDEAVAYYRKRGMLTTGEREDAPRFFKRGGAYQGFETWWRSGSNKHRAAFNEGVRALHHLIVSLED
jgi:AIPR protein